MTAARAGTCPLCQAPPGEPCNIKPPGDHLARYLDAYVRRRRRPPAEGRIMTDGYRYSCCMHCEEDDRLDRLIIGHASSHVDGHPDPCAGGCNDGEGDDAA